MKSCPQPPCHACDSTIAVYESDLLGCRLCYQCIRVIASWMGRRGLVDSNELCRELFIPALGYFNSGTGIIYIDETRLEI